VAVWEACRVADDWFRLPDWSPEAQAHFEARLARARPYNRAQYMRIKGLALADAGEKRGARQLWERVLESTEELAASQHASALEHLGDSYARDDSAAAEEYFRRLLAEHPTLNGTSHTVEISLAELLIDKGDRASMEQALALLNSFLERGTSQFPSVVFRWHLALIRIAQATGEKETVRRAARTALNLAGRGPVFPRHKTVGVVQADAKTLRRLRRLAR
jgi:tetratricopeptide (TPR) repeat protein